MEMKETRAKMNKTIRYVLENINKLDKSLAGLIKKNKEKTQSNLKWKRRRYNRPQRKTKGHKRQLEITAWQENGYPGTKGQILRKVQSSEDWTRNK